VRRAAALAEARVEAVGCRRCDLWRNATQVVFGEGTTRARALLVGEQPGDVEDESGRPFVGPAGTLLRTILGEVGLDERELYLTNAVKHFKWRPKGTRRIHDKPTWGEVRACDHWLRLELSLVRPELVVCLGSTAAQALLGRAARVTALRGRLLETEEIEAPVVVTLHPSAVLRAGDRRRQLRGELAEDLTLVRRVLDGGPAAPARPAAARRPVSAALREPSEPRSPAGGARSARRPSGRSRA
jgi:DNA polymerase